MRRLVSPLVLVVATLIATTGCASAGNRFRDTTGADPAATSSAAAPAVAAADASPATTMPSSSSMAGIDMTPSPSVAPMAAASQPAVPPQEFDPVVPPVLAGKVHDIDLPIRDVTIDVAPGRTVAAWTFGGTVPGPVIHVTVGDMVRVHLTNETQMTHSIDFHASQTAMDDQMVAIAPGATWTYTFTAEYAGVWMYHCGTGPTLLHIANGMYGMVIVDPREPLPPVDHEYALVQSEWYLGENGQPTDYAKASEAAPSPDFVVFNGVANQYKDHPLEVAPGDDVRFYVLDAGPNVDSSFHVVGTIFHRVMKEGILMDAATNGGWGSQAVDLAPAQAAIIDLTIPEAGMYVFVTHAFNNVQLGAAGILKAGDGMPPANVGGSPAPAATPATAPSAAPAAPSDPTPVPSAVAGTASRAIELDETGALQITQDGQPVSDLQVKEGETIHFRITNSAGFDHDFYIGTADQLSEGQVAGLPGVPTFQSGTQEFDYTVTAATAGLEFGCTVPGHYQLMHGTFTVEP
jgi:nitrite reductase (NO-forming)